MNDAILPSFSRVEIRVRDKEDLLVAALELKHLAGELEFIAGQRTSQDDALVLAHHKIRSTSKKLRGTDAN